MDLKRAPRQTQYEVLKELKISILDEAKVCPAHLDASAWNSVTQLPNLVNKFSQHHIHRLIEILRNTKPKLNHNASSGNY